LICNLFGKKIEKRLLPNDTERIRKIVSDICNSNAKNILIIKKLAMNKFVNFVESILCLSHPEFLRFSQTKSFER